MPAYKLIGRLAVPCPMIEAGLLFGSPERVVARTQVGPLLVSTVFLCIDHNHSGAGEPLLFETMVLADAGEGHYQTRCSTWDEAEAMHLKGVAFADSRVSALDQVMAEIQVTLRGLPRAP